MQREDHRDSHATLIDFSNTCEFCDSESEDGCHECEVAWEAYRLLSARQRQQVVKAMNDGREEDNYQADVSMIDRLMDLSEDR